MSLPLALTMGEPAGIGGEITLLAWLKRREAAVPPFFAIDDPSRLERLAAALGWRVTLRPIGGPEDAASAFAEALPVLPLSLPQRAKPGQPDPANAPAVLAAITTGVSLVTSRSRRGDRDQSDSEGSAVRCRLPPSRPHRVPRRARRRRDAGDDALLPRAARRPGHHPPVAPSGSRGAQPRAHRRRRTDRRRRRSRAISPSRGRGSPLPASTRMPASMERSVARRSTSSHRPSPRCAPPASTRTGPAPADTLFHDAARPRYDAVLCMYHDQALIPLKTIDFDARRQRHARLALHPHLARPRYRARYCRQRQGRPVEPAGGAGARRRRWRRSARSRRRSPERAA